MMGIQIYKYLIKNTSRNHHQPSHLFSSTFLSPLTHHNLKSSTILSSHSPSWRNETWYLITIWWNEKQRFRKLKFISIILSHISYLEYDFIDFWPFVLSLGRFVNGREFAQKIQTDHKMWEIIILFLFHFLLLCSGKLSIDHITILSQLCLIYLLSSSNNNHQPSSHDSSLNLSDLLRDVRLD